MQHVFVEGLGLVEIGPAAKSYAMTQSKEPPVRQDPAHCAQDAIPVPGMSNLRLDGLGILQVWNSATRLPRRL